MRGFNFTIGEGCYDIIITKSKSLFRNEEAFVREAAQLSEHFIEDLKLLVGLMD